MLSDLGVTEMTGDFVTRYTSQKVLHFSTMLETPGPEVNLVLSSEHTQKTYEM